MLVGSRLMAQRPEAQAFLRHVAQLASPAEFQPGRSSHTIRLFREVQLTCFPVMISSKCYLCFALMAASHGCCICPAVYIPHACLFVCQHIQAACIHIAMPVSAADSILLWPHLMLQSGMQGKVHVARAAHSVGLFGGVCTDYSGGLCLHAAMPKACFVACQLQPMEPSQSRGMLQCYVHGNIYCILGVRYYVECNSVFSVLSSVPLSKPHNP